MPYPTQAHCVPPPRWARNTTTRATPNTGTSGNARYPRPYTSTPTPHVVITEWRPTRADRRMNTGPNTTPNPRAINNKPTPPSPASNARLASTANRPTTPVPKPPPALASNSDETTGLLRAYCRPSMVSRMGRIRTPTTDDSWWRVLRRIDAMSMPATAKLTASTAKAVLRPKREATTAPNAEPMANMAPQTIPVAANATGRSSGSTRLGSAAPDAGPKNADSPAISPWAMNPNPTQLLDARKNSVAAPTCSNEQTTMIRLRS